MNRWLREGVAAVLRGRRWAAGLGVDRDARDSPAHPLAPGGISVMRYWPVLWMLVLSCGPLRYITPADRAAAASARSKLEVLGQQAQAAHLQTTASTSLSAAENVAQVQQAMGSLAAVVPVEQPIQDGIRAEFTGDAQLLMRAQLNGLQAALDRQNAEAARLKIESEQDHARFAAWQGKALQVGLGAAGLGGAGWIATLLLGVARAKAAEYASEATSRGFQKYKKTVEAGTPPAQIKVGELMDDAVAEVAPSARARKKVRAKIDSTHKRVRTPAA